MKTYLKCLFVPIKSAEIINNALHWKKGDPDYYKLEQNQCISYTIQFHDDIVMRISCNTLHLHGILETYEDIPWTEAVLLKIHPKKGPVELCHSEIKKEYFLRWELEYNSETFIVDVCIEGKLFSKKDEAINYTIPTLKQYGILLKDIEKELDYRDLTGISYKGWNDRMYYYTSEQLKNAKQYWKEKNLSLPDSKIEYKVEEAEKFDVAFLKKTETDGLSLEEIFMLYKKLETMDGISVYPIELEAYEHECSVMGFITTKAAEKLNYDYEKTGFHTFMASIMDDMDKESPDHIYKFKGLRISLSL